MERRPARTRRRIACAKFDNHSRKVAAAPDIVTTGPDIVTTGPDIVARCPDIVARTPGVRPLASTRVGVVADIWPHVGRIPQPAAPRDIATAVLQAHREGISQEVRDWLPSQSASRMAADWAAWLAEIAALPHRAGSPTPTA
jgi:hypothetical protein